MGGLIGALFQMQNAATSLNARYIKIASLELTNEDYQEGISNTVTLLVIGGNNYTTIGQVSFVSITSHRSIISAQKNTLLDSVEIGYSVNGLTLDVWVHCVEYNHYINSVLLGTTRAVLCSDAQEEMPANYQVIE